MRKLYFLLVCLMAFHAGKAQLLTTSPAFLQESTTNAEVTADATLGNQGLLNHTPTTDVYVHVGVITNYSTGPGNWKYVPAASVWGSTNSAIQCTYVSANKWKYTFTGTLRSFFGITDPTEKILKIAILFRSGSGSKKLANTDGGDMYIPVYDNSLAVRLDQPFRKANYTASPETITKAVGDNISIQAKSNQAAALTVYLNGVAVGNAASATQVTGNPVITAPGNQRIIAEAVSGSNTVRDTIDFFVNGTVNVAALPAGAKEGINYDAADATKATLVLYAPNKTRVSVLGDFNNWTETIAHQMNRTPDGNYYWVTLSGLTAGTEYAYQYLIDGSLKVADPNTEKVLDPWNDQYIPASTYPSLKPYPTGLTTGIVSVLQTNQVNYNWQANSFVRPDKKNLVIYELLVRDFLSAPNWQNLKDTLDYLKRLGVNAIELMPVTEFEGNLSWGYNVSFFFAPDKYYGTSTALKQFIDACHSKGIAVILDMVMNHAFGQSPLVQMYWNSSTNKPAANSPWFNVDAKHPYNVGYDFNHESQATKDLVSRVVRHWLTKYKVDGFRWDLSKGFTQTNSCTTANCDQGSEVSNWGNYDASRIATWKRIYDSMQQVSTGSYCILEHFATNSEEIELSNYGMLLWGNSNYNFNEATMGWVSTSNFQYGIHTNRGWANPHLVTYQESHDEERLMYKNVLYGNSTAAPAYDAKVLATALKRSQMAAAFWAMIPGPKLMWQFGELGYDFSINRCGDGSINNSCRTDAKPIRWDYYQNADRFALFDVYRKAIQLKLAPGYSSTFTTSNVSYSLGGSIKWMVLNEPTLRVMVIGNFDVTAQTTTVTFPTSGTWYSYLTGTTRVATGGTETITLQPGEYYIYTDRLTQVVLSLNPNTGNNTVTRDSAGYVNDIKVRVFANPITPASTIEYSTVRSGNVRMVLTDMNGRILTNIVNGYTNKGTYRITATAAGISKLTAGMYLLQTELNGRKRIDKVIIAEGQ